MASEGPPPPYNSDYPPPFGNPPPPQAYPPNNAPYPPQASYLPPAAPPPSYSSQDPSKYPVQSAPPYPYPPSGAAPGYSTQNIGGVAYANNQTTIITQPAGGVIIFNPPPPDFMSVSIISVFCCFFIGIFAVLKSIKSRELYRSGDRTGAQLMGLQAKKTANISILVGICIYVLIVIFRIVSPFIDR